MKLIEEVGQQKKKAKTVISYCKGVAYQLKGRWDEAIDEYDKAIEIIARDAMVYNNREGVYFSKSQYDKASLDCSKALDINPWYDDAYNSRGDCLFLQKRIREGMG